MEEIKKAQEKDLKVLVGFASELFGENSFETLYKEFSELLLDNNAIIYIIFIDSIPVGFAQCQLRFDYVEGTQTSPVGYLEGIYIKEKYRNNGYAKRLLNECEIWAKSKGCIEFASDCEITNSQSVNFHLKAGFHEANRIICFTKNIK